MKNENSEIVPALPQDLHERLCAYVFGELEPAERAAFEAELARSSALRAEHSRLAATIGLVKAAVPDEGLSEAVRRDLFATARRSRFRLVTRRRVALLAAAAVLVTSGVLALRFVQERSPFVYDVHEGAKLARHEAPERAVERDLGEAPATKMRERKADKDAVAELRSLGYVAGEAGAPAPAAAAPPAETPAAESLAFNSVASQARAKGVGPASPGPQLAANSGSPVVPASRGSGQDGFFLGSGERRRDAPAAPSIQQALVRPTDAAEVLALSKEEAPAEEPRLYALGLEAGAERREPLDALSFDVPDEPVLLDAIGYADEATDEEEDGYDRRANRVPVQPVLTRDQVVEEIDRLLGACRIAPGESPRDMFFRYFGDAPFVLALEERTSTFAVDVDTASYALARAYLERGQLPPREAVRTEEFVNYFKADLEPPTDGNPFAIGLELAPSLFASDPRTEMLRVTVRAKDVPESERRPVALTFVIDNSGSMRQEDRLELVKRSLGKLLSRLDANDTVAVVKFSNTAGIVLQPTSAGRKGEIESWIGGIGIEGGTNVEAGLRLGYELAREHLRPGSIHRVILCSDGVGNIGETSAKALLALVDDARKQGIYLNTVGVGMGNHNDAFLEQLANEGDGVCSYVDSDAEAQRVFVDGLAQALVPVARDVKIQVELDPAQVESWRLLGYENRALRTQDFRNDAIDAGEVNAGHQVTALYELVRHPSRSGPLATVRLRYKPPHAVDTAVALGRDAGEANETALEIERTASASDVRPGFAAASNGTQRAMLVAQFAEVLRRSVHARGDSFATLLRESQRLAKALGDPDFDQFVGLLARANPLLDARAQEETPSVQVKLDELSRLHYELALRERRRELARQAGEPEPAPEAQAAEAAALRDAQEAIERLEAEVEAEILRLRGFEPADEPHGDTDGLQRPLEGLGYGDEDDR